MLIRFTVENAFCFSEEASISMVASKDKAHPKHVIYDSGGKVALLRAAAIYGANGHGKTNLVNAIREMQNIVIERSWRIPRFKLDSTYGEQPSRMVAEFRHKNTDFEYGLVVRGKVVEAEWLYQLNRDEQATLIFERETVKTGKTFSSKVNVGEALRDQKSPLDSISIDMYVEVLCKGLKENKAFLSEGGERDVPLVDIAYSWFDTILNVISADAAYTGMFDRLESEEDFAHSVQEVLNGCDVGIEAVGVRETKVDTTKYEFSANLRQKIDELSEGDEKIINTLEGPAMIIAKGSGGKLTFKELFTSRRNLNEELIEFSLSEESSGTRRMLDLAPMLADSQDEAVYVVDELDRKLHPLLAYNFIKRFLEISDCQLVFTTHNTFLMNLDLLRKDEIWFVQKRKGGGSSVYALAEYKFDPKVDIRDGYFQGRFGAIPFIADASMLGWDGAELTE